MHRHLLFVNLNINIRWNKGLNHGIAFLAPVIKKYGYQVSCITLNSRISAGNFKTEIARKNPSIVAFSCTSHHLKYLSFYSRAIGDLADILQIAGGLGPTLDREWVFSNSDIRGICLGEGEVPLAGLLDALNRGKDALETPGFYWQVNGKIKENPVPPFVSDLSSLEFPDYSIYPEEVVVQDEMLSLILSRGCPYDCFFCCNNAKRKLYPQSQGFFRLPTVEHALNAVKQVVGAYPKAEGIVFDDDLLVVDKIWFEKFAAEYSRLIHKPYRLNMRVENISPDIARILKETGCTQVTVGVESGSEYLRSVILNKKFSDSVLLEGIAMVRQEGIGVNTLSMIGLPSETRRQMRQTLDINKKISPDGGRCFFFYPYKGTHLYELCRQRGLLPKQADLLTEDNLSDRLSIRMGMTGRFWCYYYYRRISRFLEDCYIRSTLRRLSYGLEPGPIKLFLLACQWCSLKLIMSPRLFSIAHFLATILGIRSLYRMLIKRRLKL